MKKPVVVLLHVGYWVIYLLLFLLILAILHQSGPPKPHIHYSLGQIILACLCASGFTLVPAMLSFYSFYNLLFTKILLRKRIWALCIYGVLVSIACGLVGALLVKVSLMAMGKDYSQPQVFIFHVIIIFYNALANGIVGLVMRGFITSYGDIKVKEELNKKNYEMELALIKNQINPHFLFNTLNNIDVMITKDAAKASVYLNKLSDIMRFMLYETKAESIPLSKELTYIEKYVELQKIRTSNSSYVNYKINGDADDLMIAPMLFIPFIENAFKHTEDKKLEDAININIHITKEKIIFDCENRFIEESQNKADINGLGNELIKKRLELLYPKRHTLEVNTKGQVYSVRLTILFHED
jgi:two-component system LytT family sensor kinase